jgi:hypothetical protein
MQVTKKLRIEAPKTVVVSGAFNNQPPDDSSLPTINKTLLIPNSEKELRKLCDDALADINVLKLSQQEIAKEKVYEALRLNGFHRIYDVYHSKKRTELLSIRAKAIDYQNAIPSSTTDLSELSEEERNAIMQYRFKNLPNIESRIQRIIFEEVEITKQLNYWNHLHFINLKEQAYLRDIKQDVKYNVNAEFVKNCIDSYMSSLNTNNHHVIVREPNVLIDDTNNRGMMLQDDTALLGSDLNEHGEMDHRRQ